MEFFNWTAGGSWKNKRRPCKITDFQEVTGELRSTRALERAWTRRELLEALSNGWPWLGNKTQEEDQVLENLKMKNIVTTFISTLCLIPDVVFFLGGQKETAKYNFHFNCNIVRYWRDINYLSTGRAGCQCCFEHQGWREKWEIKLKRNKAVPGKTSTPLALLACVLFK